MPMVMASCVSGSAPEATYWKNAWKMPTVSWPASSIWPAMTAMVTWHRRSMKRMMGPTALVRKSDLALVVASSSAAASISAALASSRPKALMTARPV